MWNVQGPPTFGLSLAVAWLALSRRRRATGLSRAPAKPLPFADGAPRPLPGAALTLRRREEREGAGYLSAETTLRTVARNIRRVSRRENRSRSLKWRLITFASRSAASCVKFQESRIQFRPSSSSIRASSGDMFTLIYRTFKNFFPLAKNKV